MGKIFYVMGKSASGKDTIYKQLHARMPELKTVRMYTTRPIRDGETDGVEYFFVDDGRLEQCRENGTLIECRTYDTVYGPWNYFTVEDGQQTGKVLEAFSKAFMGGETAEPPFKDFTRGHFKRGVE